MGWEGKNEVWKKIGKSKKDWKGRGNKSRGGKKKKCENKNERRKEERGR